MKKLLIITMTKLKVVMLAIKIIQRMEKKMRKIKQIKLVEIIAIMEGNLLKY